MGHLLQLKVAFRHPNVKLNGLGDDRAVLGVPICQFYRQSLEPVGTRLLA